MIVSSSSASASSKKAARGAFIVLEGVDRCGKTTQVARLVQHLTTSCAALAGGASAWGFPNRTTAVGQLINAYLQSSSESEAPLSDEAIHLLFSANRWESAANLEATLAAGTHVICDRYAYSGVAFSSAKKGLSAAWCRAPDRGLPAPDAVLYLDLEPAAAADRGGYGEERYEQRDFQAVVRQRFLELRDVDTRLASGGPPWHMIEAAQSMDDVEAAIWAVVEPLLATVGPTPVGKLWMDEAAAGAAGADDEKPESQPEAPSTEATV